MASAIENRVSTEAAPAAEAEEEPLTLEQAFGVDGERTLGSFSCELELPDETDDVFVGRLFVFESAAGFYANVLGREVVEAVPFRRVDDLSKRNLAIFLPHAIDISVAGRTVRRGTIAPPAVRPCSTAFASLRPPSHKRRAVPAPLARVHAR
jgi:hypothetical protein